MSRLTNIHIDTSIRRLAAGEADRRRIPAAELRHMLFHLYLIRAVEQRLLELKDDGLVHGPVHSSIGQEGTAVGAMQVLGREDRITSTHRGHHHFLAKAYNAYAGTEYDPTEGIPAAIEEVTLKAMAEIMGLSLGYCRGRGGSMHLGDRYSGCIGTNAIVAGGVPCAAGVAWAAAIDKRDILSVAFMGDGAVNQGSVFETMNMAATWKLPVVFFVENNMYAVATRIYDVTSLEYPAQRGCGFGIPSVVVDGMDVTAVHSAMLRAREHCLKDGAGPLLIEARNYRFKHQAQGLPGSAYGYRTREEEAEWRKRDPVTVFASELQEDHVVTADADDELRSEVERIVAASVAELTTGGEKMIVKPDLYPAEDDLLRGIRSDGHEFDEVPFVAQPPASDTPRKFIDVIPEVIQRRMDEDASIVILGEEVGNMRGGVFMATKGIYKVYPDRVFNTPISECGFSGMALGLAISGKKPIIEIMYPDFTLVAADQIFNQIGKFRYMYGDQENLPIVLRTKVGIGTGYGAQHSLEPAPLYAMFPGWRIVAPSTAAEYVGLFNSAVTCLDPVLVIEHAALYECTDKTPDDRDYYLPFGAARVARPGSDVTVVSYSYMTRKALAAAEDLKTRGVDAEVIDLRTVDYDGIDYETIGRSIAKTGRVVVCEEGLYCGGLGAQISFEIQRRFFDLLDAEIGRVAGTPVPVPVSVAQETRAVPQPADVVRAVSALMPPGPPAKHESDNG